MAFFFDVYGSFEVRRKAGLVTAAQGELWHEMDAFEEDLKESIGCYMFCLANGTNIRPWYVGKTEARGGFKAEAFTPHKLEIYNGCLEENRGRPRLFLFPLLTCDDDDRSRFSKNRSSGSKVIDWLEKTLMGMALQTNPGLWNTRDLTLPRSVTVRGIIGEKQQGRPYSEVAEARRALFGKNS
jgi:hypothetical protein